MLEHAAGDAPRASASAAGPSPRAPLPPLSERDAWIVLGSVAGVGPVSFERVVSHFGGALAVLDVARDANGEERLISATSGDSGHPTLSREAAAAVRRIASEPAAELERIANAGVTAVTLGELAYPRRLREIELPPPVLFVRGDPAVLSRQRAVAVVGTRRPSESGRMTASRIADALASVDATVVSGLALGIDGAAHAAAVARSGPTVAVLGGGHDHLYPRSHRRLAEEIVATGGAIVSEFEPAAAPSRGTFPRRNRIISGLSDATVVVEAGSRSGALTTAAWALEQGRKLFLVPGSIDVPQVAGCLAFLRELAPEARIVAGVPELIEDLGLVAPDAESAPRGRGRIRGASREAALASLGLIERDVARAIASGAVTVDAVVVTTALPLGAVLGALTALEMRGLIVDVFGRYRALGSLAVDDGRRGTAGATRRARSQVVNVA
ncbi:MAG: DNA-processing protein DprA [Chloroflexota bacterium]